MDVEIRVLQHGDANILTSVASEVFDDPVVMGVTERFLADPRNHLVVARDEGLVVGFISAVHYDHPDKPRPELWINEVSVAPSHQSQGIGSRLMQAVLQEGRKAGCAEAWVLTERANMAARRLYSKAGGTESPDKLVMVDFDLDQGAG